MVSVLLDTHVFIWSVIGAPMSTEAVEIIADAAEQDALGVSIVTAWEIGLLARNVATPTGRMFAPDPKAWVDKALSNDGVMLVPLSVEAATRAWSLPEPFHKDPADRLLVATARALHATLVTRDRAILDYAALGHVRAIAC